ncbi:5757_t:CDS:2 [Ambispora gerdemannii]|uniref:5757_t:CDS:1 n=1 Tax=Ambispora gerdemannii TaxID=144530 RepID=A0A9N9B2L6_9GLOM|nr:5757_t:CDS:2 [Ambispora gerdemannii]
MTTPKTLGFWELFKYRKPVIFYGGKLHFVERNSAHENKESRNYALFRVYNLKCSLAKLRQEIISIVGLSTKIEFTHSSAYAKSSMQSLGDENTNTSKCDVVKIRILFRNSTHQTVINRLYSSLAIRELTENGFNDWIPLDITSYHIIEPTWRLIVVSTDNWPPHSDVVKQTLLTSGIDDIIRKQNTYQGLAELFHGQVYKVERDNNHGSGNAADPLIVVETRTFNSNPVFVEVYNWIFEYGMLNEENLDTCFISLLVSSLNVYTSLFCLNDVYENLSTHGWGSFGNTIFKGESPNVTLIKRIINLEQVLTEIQLDSFKNHTYKLHDAIDRLTSLFEKDAKDLEMRTRIYIVRKLRILLMFVLMTAIFTIVVVYHYWNMQQRLFSIQEMTWLFCVLSIFTFIILYTKQGINNYARFSAWFMKAAQLHRETVKDVLWDLRENLNRVIVDLNGRELVLRYVLNCIVDVCSDLRDTISNFGEI